MAISIKDGQLRLTECLGNLDSKQLHEELGASLVASIKQGMQKEQAPDGTAWQALSPVTVKQRKGNSHPILRVRGNLYRSIVYQAETDQVEVGSRLAETDQMETENRLKGNYAAVHQFGAEIKRTRKSKLQARVGSYVITVPARPYLYNPDGTVPDSWKKPLLNIVINNLKQVFAE